jgi:hypothetical protein
VIVRVDAAVIAIVDPAARATAEFVLVLNHEAAARRPRVVSTLRCRELTNL